MSDVQLWNVQPQWGVCIPGEKIEVSLFIRFMFPPVDQVGLPAKSGVSGVVLTVIPGLAGFATWSPSLDTVGNSVRGVRSGHLMKTQHIVNRI